jgi:hypothetical protein
LKNKIDTNSDSNGDDPLRDINGKLGLKNEDEDEDWPQPVLLLLVGSLALLGEALARLESLGGLQLMLLILLKLLLLELSLLLLLLLLCITEEGNGIELPRAAGMSVELFHLAFFDLDAGKSPPGPLLSNLKGLEVEVGVTQPSVADEGVSGGAPISILPME